MTLKVLVEFGCDNCKAKAHAHLPWEPDFFDDITINPDLIEGWNTTTRFLPWPHDQLKGTKYEGKYLLCPACIHKIRTELGLQ